MLKIKTDGTRRSARAWKLIPSLAFSGALLSVTANAQAHVKWFADSVEPEPLPTPDAGTVMLVLFLLAVGVILAKMVDSIACQFSLTPRRLLSESTRPLRLVYYLIAIYFLGAALSSTFLAPHIRVPVPLMYFGVAVQLLIYTLLLMDRGRVIAAVLIALMFVVAGFYDPLFVLEYPLLLALAWIVLYADERPSGVALLLVRFLLGLSLISLAFTEKLNDPSMAMSLLNQYDFNFMEHLGFAYDDRLFVYSAGIVELLLGLVFISGLVSRLTVMVLFAFMIATNSYFLAVGETRMALVEFIGHLPIFACGILLLFYHPTAAVAKVEQRSSLAARGGRATSSATVGRLR